MDSAGHSASWEGSAKQPAYALVRGEDYRIHDDWHVAVWRRRQQRPCHRRGFCAEPSLDDGGAGKFGSSSGGALHGGPLYRVPLFSSFSFFIAGPITGMGRGAIDQYIETVRGRKPREEPPRRRRHGKSADRAVKGRRSGNACRRCTGAPARSRDRYDGGGCIGRRCFDRPADTQSRAQTFATRLVAEAIDEIYEASGATAFL